jgi:peroxiredoxin family protein
MAGAPLYILLCSSEHENVQMAAMMAAVAAVSERRVEVFVSMNGIAAFACNAGEDERYGDSGRFAQLLKAKCAPDPIDLLRQGKELGELKLWACSMALDVLGWEVAHLVDGLFDGPLGLTKFLSDAEAGQLVSF